MYIVQFTASRTSYVLMHIIWIRVELLCIETGVAVERVSGGMTHDI